PFLCFFPLCCCGWSQLPTQWHGSQETRSLARTLPLSARQRGQGEVWDRTEVTISYPPSLRFLLGWCAREKNGDVEGDGPGGASSRVLLSQPSPCTALGWARRHRLFRVLFFPVLDQFSSSSSPPRIHGGGGGGRRGGDGCRTGVET